MIHIEQWHRHPSLVGVFRDRVKTAWEWLPDSIRNDSLVIFTAHSLAGRPEVLQAFEKQLTELAESIVGILYLCQNGGLRIAAPAHTKVYGLVQILKMS